MYILLRYMQDASKANKVIENIGIINNVDFTLEELDVIDEIRKR